MDMLDGLIVNYQRFLSWEEFSFLLTVPGLLIMLNLVLSEGLLSFDNALVLAILVGHLPRDRFYRIGPCNFSIQQWALTAGLVGAYVFRLLAIGLGSYLIQFWSLQLIGGGYLLWLAFEHFFAGDEDSGGPSACGKGFWGTVLKVELMDIAFSIDSILAALGISKKVWVVLAGGMLGILFMRFVSGIFVRLIDRFPLLTHTGYALVSLIGYRLVSEVHWSHFEALLAVLGPIGIGVVALFTVVVWGSAHVRRERLGAVKTIIELTGLIMFFSWSGTTWKLHLSDLAFSAVMLATFLSTFLFNGMYLRWKSGMVPVRVEDENGSSPRGLD